MSSAVLDALRGVRWYVRELTGESKWDEYVARCRQDAAKPMSRRNYEKHRSQQQEHSPQSRCC